MKTLEQVFENTQEELEADGWTINGLAIYRGENAYAREEGAVADGDGTTAVGEGAKALYDGATAIGNGASATGVGAIAIGDYTDAWGLGAIVFFGITLNEGEDHVWAKVASNDQ